MPATTFPKGICKLLKCSVLLISLQDVFILHICYTEVGYFKINHDFQFTGIFIICTYAGEIFSNTYSSEDFLNTPWPMDNSMLLNCLESHMHPT